MVDCVFLLRNPMSCNHSNYPLTCKKHTHILVYKDPLLTCHLVSVLSILTLRYMQIAERKQQPVDTVGNYIDLKSMEQNGWSTQVHLQPTLNLTGPNSKTIKRKE